MLFASNLYSLSIVDEIKKLFSINLSDDVFDSINKEIIGSLHAKNLRLHLPNRVSMDDLEVLDEFGERVLYGKHVELSISLFSLLSNNIVVSDASVEAPFFRYTIKNNIHNVIHVFETPPAQKKKAPEKEKSKLRISIAHVRVHDGSYEMEHDVGLKIIAEGIQAQGKFWVEKGPFGVDISEATISRGNIQVAGMDLPITELVSRNLYISDEKVSTTYLKAFYERAILNAEGSVFIEDNRYEIAATLTTPKNTYPQGLTKLPFISPSILAKIVMAGPLSEPEFKVNADIGETEFNGLKINSGNIVANINQHQIFFESSALNVGDKGRIIADGVVDIEKDQLAFRSTQKNLSSADLLKFLSLDFKSSGRINATTVFEGKLGLARAPMKIFSTGSVTGASFEEAKFADKSDFLVSIILDLSKRLTFNEIKVSDAQGLRVKAKGEVDLKSPRGSFSYDINCANPHLYLSYLLPKDINVKKIASIGQLSWEHKNLSSQGSLNLGELAYKNFTTNDAKIEYNLANDELSLSQILASFYKGEIKGFAKITGLKKQQDLSGQLDIRGVDLSLVSGALGDINIMGQAGAKLVFSGPTSRLQVNFSAFSEPLIIDKIDIKNIKLTGVFYDHRLEISQVLAQTNSGTLEGSNLSFHTKREEISGSLFLSDINVAPLLFKYISSLEGLVSGPVDIGGTWSSPQIHAPLIAKNMSIMGQKLGSGPLSINLKKEKLTDTNSEEDIVFSFSSLLSEEKAVSNIRFALALNHQTINTSASFSDFQVNSADFELKNSWLGAKGLIFANISAQGPLLSPRLDAQITASEYGFFDPRKHNASLLIKKKYGPATVKASIEHGRLQLDLCAPWSKGVAKEGCSFERGVSVSLSGPFNLDEFSIDINSVIKHDHLEEIIPLLNDELATVNADARIKGKLIKRQNQPLSYDFKFYLEQVLASLPNIPRIQLNKPVIIDFDSDGIVLRDDVVFIFSPGQLTLKGSLLKNHLNINLSGAIPLVLSKFVVPMIQRGEGLAFGDLRISGTLDAPVFDGICAPEKGAMLTFRKWVESLEFKDGKVVFHKTSEDSFTSKFENIKLGIGDGRLAIKGAMKKQYASAKQSGLSTFDVNIEGSNIIIRDKNDFVETDFKFDTIKAGNESSVLSGKITVIDGSAYRQFDLRNFVIQATETSNGDVSKMLENIDLKLNLEIAVRQFRASMRMLNIDVDAFLTGQLKAAGPIHHPKFTGGLSVSEGAITFPAATFDLVESRIDLDELTDRSFDPKIMIVSTQEFEQGFFPVAQDTLVELSLKGNLDRLNLELKPVNGDMRLSQTRIFLMLLMPRGLGGNANDKFEAIPQEAKNAVVAFTGEVFLRPFTNQLQELLEGTTKTRIQFGSAVDPSGLTLRLNWKVGPRIEVQGSYMFINEDARTPGEDQLSLYGNYPFRDLKLKLLLFDHRPFGPLFLESSFGANRDVEGTFEPRGKIRLTYRILSR